MARYILKRLLLSIPILFGISLITFAVIHITPGGPTVVQSQMNAKMSPDSIAKLKTLYGLDKPLHIQYLNWLSRLVRFDFGESFNDNRPVTGKILERLPATLQLNILSLLLLFLIAVPLGVYSAARENSVFERLFTSLSFVGFSIPAFWLALLLMLFFGVWLQWLPISGMVSVNSANMPPVLQVYDRIQHLLLPLFVSVFGSIAGLSRYMKSGMLEVIRQDYIRTARAKGLPERDVLLKHALRNALLPVITIVGLSIPGLISGGFIFETIFAWPGMGRLAYESAMSFDYPVIMGVVIAGALLTLLGNLLADIAYAFADPRIRY